MRRAAAPGQNYGECPPLRVSSGKGPNKETEGKRKQGQPGQNVIPDTREESSRRTDHQWGQYQWQVRERFKFPTASGNIELTGGLCLSKQFPWSWVLQAEE